MKGGESNLYNVIPISFYSHSTLREHYKTFCNLPLEKYCAVTRSKTKAEGTQVSNVHGID